MVLAPYSNTIFLDFSLQIVVGGLYEMNAKPAKSRGQLAQPSAPVRQRAKRMPAEARKAVILKEASDFFAQHGFSASTRDLADRIGVRQALLYKYFPSKEALIESIFDHLVEEREQSPRSILNADTSKPLARRIMDVYHHIASLSDGSGVRLISRAVLQDLPIGKRLGAFLTQKLFKPILEEIRAVEKLPALDSKPVMVGEYELIMSMHSSALFYLLRRDLGNLPLPEDPDAAFLLAIETFLVGARTAMPGLHRGDGSAALARPMAE
jgi:AcrR family transcriptional regulator